MNVLIVTCGHLGATLRAGQILAEYLPWPCQVVDTLKKPKIRFEGFDCVVFGANVRMGRLNRRFFSYYRAFKRAKTGARVFG